MTITDEHVNGKRPDGWVVRSWLGRFGSRLERAEIPAPYQEAPPAPRERRAKLKPGEGVIRVAAALLALLAAGLLYVSFAAQFSYVLSERHQVTASWIEALSMDAAMIVLSLLAFGLAVNGQNAKTARALVMLFAVLSGVMNYAAANTISPRSILAYALPPVALAIIADQTVTTVRRHILHVRGEDEVSSWSGFGRVAAVLSLRVLRFAFAPVSTAKDVRHRVLALAPLLEDEPITRCAITPPEVPAAIDPPPTKRAQLEAAYKAHPDAWNRPAAARIATGLAAEIGMSPGTARGYVGELLKQRDVA